MDLREIIDDLGLFRFARNDQRHFALMAFRGCHQRVVGSADAARILMIIVRYVDGLCELLGHDLFPRRCRAS